MKALVLRSGRAVVEDRPIPRAGPNDVIVRTTLASACSADIACITGGFTVPEGIILGHEAVGIVHEVGSLVQGFAPGQRVTALGTASCGRCANCQRGHGGHCGGVEWGGYSSGVARDGSLAEYFTVTDADRNLSLIPDGLRDDQAICATDTLAAGLTAVETAQIPLGGSVVIFGQGHVGLAATAGVRLRGAATIVTVTARPGREAISRAMGADQHFNFQTDDPVEAVLRLTGGVGADVVIEATGVRDAFKSAVAATRIGGTIVVLSSYSGPPDATLDIPLAHWGWGIGDKTILSPFARTGSERLGRILKLMETGRIDVTPLVTHRYAFADVERAIGELVKPPRDMVKPVISFP